MEIQTNNNHSFDPECSQNENDQITIMERPFTPAGLKTMTVAEYKDRSSGMKLD
jgi:hypothetical protein